MDSKDLKNPKILRKYIDEFGEDLVKTQVSLEAKSRSIGYQRYIANHDRLEDVGEFSQSPAGTNVVNAFDRLVTEELQAWMEKADRPGKRAHRRVERRRRRLSFHAVRACQGCERGLH